MDTAQTEERVTALLERMTLEEKIGQLAQFSEGGATGPDNVRVDQMELAARGGIGSMLNVTGAKATNDLQRQAVEKSRLGIPILFGFDVIHGLRTIYPVPLGLSASWNVETVQRCARMAAVEARAEGISWTFSPMVDIARDARWGRITEGSGEDPYLGEVMAAAWVKGYQGESLSETDAILACAKHFAAYGAAEGGREYEQADVSDRVLRDVYLPPFRAAVEAGAGSFMSGFTTVQGVPCTANPRLLTDILRDEWGFQGFVVSDWASVGELLEHGVALDGSDAARMALTAGVDMDMQSNLYTTQLAGLVESGRLEMGVLDEAVRRVLRLKLALGLFEEPYTDESWSASVILCPEHLDVARQAAEESFVLLKNEPVGGEPLLPLKGNPTVALIGPLADSQADMLGSWVLRGRGEDAVSLRQSLSERLGDRLVYARGADIEGGEDSFEEALEAAGKADVVLMALGEARNMSGEAASRTRLDLPGRQLALLQAVAATGKPVVLVLFSGRPLAIPWEAEHVPAILEVWFPGVQAGPALVRTLFGDVSPAGRLTASFPRSVGQMPLYYNRFNTGRPSHGRSPGEGFITGYRDERDTPLFPFGWGLSYTTFDYSETEITTPHIRAADLNREAEVTVEATVTNSGAREGIEVVQLYIRQRGASVARPVRELKGFQRITLAPGEARRVRFSLSKKELAFWGAAMEQAVEPGELTVWVAPHAQGGHPAQITIEP